jgi:hypothetical protein
MTKDEIKVLKQNQIAMLQVYEDWCKEDLEAHYDFIQTLDKKIHNMALRVRDMKKAQKNETKDQL